MCSFRTSSMLPSALVRTVASLPPMLLATALAAGHTEHSSVADMAVQGALLVCLAALLINVVGAAIAILREREPLEPDRKRSGLDAGGEENCRPSQDFSGGRGQAAISSRLPASE